MAAAYLIVGPTGADLPAQLLRVKLFGAEGFAIWNNWWYAGQYVLSYSVLFPALGWLLGPRLLAALAGVGTAAPSARWRTTSTAATPGWARPGSAPRP